MMKDENVKKKPVFKFNPNFKKSGLSSGNSKMESPLEQMEALKKNLEDRTRYFLYIGAIQKLL